MGDSQYYLTMAITGVGTFVLAALAFILAFNNRITEAFNMGKNSREQAQENKENLILLQARVELISRERHQMEVDLSSKISGLTSLSETTAKAVAQSETRIAKSIEDLERTVHSLQASMLKTMSEMLVKSSPPR